jgi:hypothetical protein
VTRGPIADGKQPDLFGTVPKPMASKARAAHPRAGPAGKAPPSQDGSAAMEDGITGIATKLSLAELEELAAVLSDEALARLVLAAARQLRRRLVRGGGRKGQRPSPALERAARQLAAELGRAGSTDDT